MFFFAQTAVQTEAVEAADSLRQAAQSFVEQLRTEPSAALQQLGQDLIQFGLKLLAALVIFALGAWIIKLVRRRMRKRFEKKNYDPTVETFTLSLTTAVLWILLIVISISTLGVNTTSIAALLAAGGVALGMALSGTAQNFAGGLIILIFKPFKVGDFISAQGFMGTVTEVNMFSTRIDTPENRRVVIPNGILSNGTVENYSTNGLRRAEWKFGVEYGTDVERCLEICRGILAEDDRISNAFAGVSGMMDSCVQVTVRGWVRNEDYWDIFFAVNGRLLEGLPENGISFAFPHLDVRMRAQAPKA